MHTEEGTRNRILLPVLRTFHVVLIWFVDVEQKNWNENAIIDENGFCRVERGKLYFSHEIYGK